MRIRRLNWLFNFFASPSQSRKNSHARLRVEQLEDRITPAAPTWINRAPLGADHTATMVEDTPYVFQVGDFGFTDPQDSNNFHAIRIVNLPDAGALMNDGTPVSSGDFVSVNDILAGKFAFQSAPDATGTSYAHWDFEVQDDGGTQDGGVDLDPLARTMTMNVAAVNDRPDFSAAALPPADEDAEPVSIANWATFTPGGGADEAVQTPTYIVSNVSNPNLFAALPSVAADGTLTYTLAANANGTSTFDVQAQDYGGTDNGGQDTSEAHPFTIIVNSVNDKPSFTANDALTIDEDAGSVSIPAWAVFSPGGGADEAGQLPTFHVGWFTNSSLFTALPSVDANGTLTYTLAANANGMTTFEVWVEDDGEAGYNWQNMSLVHMVSLTVTPVNDAPTFTAGSDVTVSEDSEPYVAAWASTISTGPANEEQAPIFTVTNDNASLFAVAPAIAADGTLSFILAPDAFGSAIVAVSMSDGIEPTTPVITFVIGVTSVNDVPSFTAADPPPVDEDVAPVSITGWAAFSPGGGTYEAEQTATYSVTILSGLDLFTAPPVVDTYGTLTYTLAANANGVATFEVSVQDNDGGQSPPVLLTLTVNAVNDVPVIDSVQLDNASPTTNEDLIATVNATDTEGDTITYQYEWYVNGVVEQTTPATTSTTDTLDLAQAGFGDKEDVIYVVVTPNDATESGTEWSSDTATVANTAPVASDMTFDVPHDQIATFDIRTNSFSDVDADTVQVIIVDQSDHGEATANEDGTVSFAPEAGWIGTTSFTIKGNDGSADSNVVTITVTLRYSPAELYASYLAAVGEADETYLDALQTASDVRDIVSDLSDGDYYHDADQLYADYEAAISDAEAAYDTAHAAADAAYQDAIAQADTAQSTRIDAAEAAYDTALAAADDAWNQAMQAAADAYDAALAAADLAYPVGLLQAARDQAVAASQSTAASLTVAETDLTNAIAAATTTRDQAIADANAAIDHYFIQAAIDQVGATMVANAQLAYDAALVAANTAHDAAVEPFQTAWDQADANYSNNPDDPELQTALNDAVAALNAAIAQADGERSAAQLAAQITYDEAVASAAQFMLNEQTAAVQTWQDALAAAAAAYTVAVVPYQTARNDADAANQSAQAALASAEQALTEAETNSAAAYATALADRDAAELAADEGYDLLADAALASWQAEEDAAQADFDAAGQAAWDVFQPLEDAATAAYNTAEESAWAAYEAGLADLQTTWQSEQDASVGDYNSARAAATAAWHTAEQTAWDTYTTALATDPTSPTPDVRRTDPPADPVADDNADEWADLDDSAAPPPADNDWTWDDEDPDDESPVFAEDGPEFPELYPPPEDMNCSSDEEQDEDESFGLWEYSTSPFYASTLDEAKYRAYLPARRAGAENATPIGAAVAAEFEVDAALTWGEFFPAADWNNFVRERNRAANALDPALIAALDADWQQTPAGTTGDNAIGEDIAARWSRVPGFSWVAPETGWAELYTANAARHLSELREVPIPPIVMAAGEGYGFDVDRMGVVGTTAPLVSVTGEIPPASTSGRSGLYEFYAVLDRQSDGQTGLQLLETQARAFVQRLRIASAQEVRQYLASRQPNQLFTLRVALDVLLARASAELTAAGNDNAAATAALETIRIAQAFYSEMNHQGESRYGLHDPNFDFHGFNSLPAEFAVVGLNVEPFLGMPAKFTSVAQRAAFLADTTYEEFRLRERLVIELSFGENPRDPLDRTNKARAINAIPTAEQYYLTRTLLLFTFVRSTPGAFNRESINYLLGRYLNNGYDYTPIPVDNFVDRLGNQITRLPTGTPGRPVNRYRNAIDYVYTRYLAGAFFNMNQGTGAEVRHLRTLGEYYSLDRFSLVHMALPLVVGWDDAWRETKENFADNLQPVERVALVNSLAFAAMTYRRIGNQAMAASADDMANFLNTRFNEAMAPYLENENLHHFRWVSSAQRILTGNKWVLPEERAEIALIPTIVRRLADAMATDAFMRWRALNPARVTYEPGWWFEFVDRAVLHAAEMLAPVFRTGQRLAFQRLDEWGDIEAIREVMEGNYNVTLGPSRLNYGFLANQCDGALTFLTIVPIGGAISPLRHVAMMATGGMMASFAMAAVDVAPIRPEFRMPLRLAAALAGGLAGGTLANAGLNIARNRMPLLLARTLDLWRANAALLEAQAALAARKVAGLAPTTALVRQYAEATREIRAIETHITRLRELYGTQPLEAVGTLASIENAHANALRDLARLEARAAASGLSPSRRALLAGDVRRAQVLAREAAGRVRNAYNAAEQAALNDPNLRRLTREARAADSLRQHRDNIARARAQAQLELDEFLALQARNPTAQVRNSRGRMSEVADMIAKRRGRLTELVGELAAAEHMASQPNTVMLRGFRNGGQGIDQIWGRLDSNGTIVEFIIVEAKGPGATLSTTTTPHQMTNLWVSDRLRTLARRGTAEESQLAEDILAALANRNGNVRVTRRVL